MTQKFKKGDRVEWDTAGKTTRGVVKEIITEPTDFKNHHFEASKDQPEYLVESEKSGKEAIHRAEELRKIKEES
jgi:Hypervirulence associated proteins TUDOR domain